MTGSASKREARLAGLRVGNYVLKRVLGQGRMGVVYLAEDTALLRRTAVKLLAWDFGRTTGENPLDWFLDEARHVAQINHPRVVQIYAAAKQGEHCYIAMELVDGPSAEALVAREGPLPLARAARILIDVATGLHAAHEAGIVHRDIKPANILVSEVDEGAKLGDFGMALSTRTLQEGRGRVRAGTPFYTAPELWQGALASPSADIYALGATFFFLLTGKPPFPAPSAAEVREMHLFSSVPDPRDARPDLPQSVVELLRCAMAKRPESRFESAAALAREARSLVGRNAANLIGFQDEDSEVFTTPPSESRFQPPLGFLVESLQFIRQPFATLDPLAPPYCGEPFASLLGEMQEDLASGGRTMVLTGPAGTGRSTVLERLAARLQGNPRLIFLRSSSNAATGSLVRRVGNGFGRGATSLSGVSSRIAARRRAEGASTPPPVIFVDGVGAGIEAEFEQLVGLAKSRREFSVVACIDEARAARLSPSWDRHYVLRELTASESVAYIEAWLTATRPPSAPPLLFSPDAHLLLGQRAHGALTALNHLALNAITLAAAQGRRVVTSFEAWHATIEESWLRVDGTLRTDLPERPKPWPPTSVWETIVELRAARIPLAVGTSSGVSTSWSTNSSKEALQSLPRG